eukprot:CAMPEP_0180144646 /NCGR_PEP_ID=MMETSP0986-20121125/17079_1 /TAXON_ID=697907 /ORGANISM="non described non described, Strain CCMP2293" /LENGTH=66 /DNA_ID=CAMNT_0022088633 /DNA_START=58 /DNA_END=255 /DNA_ORIENTATION=+
MVVLGVGALSDERGNPVRGVVLQGYLALRKEPPLRTLPMHSRAMPRALRWSLGVGARSYERDGSTA